MNIFARIFKWFSTARQPKIWAVRSKYDGSAWSKVVSISRFAPVERSNFDCAGPFRSEMDCEQFCDHSNCDLLKHVLNYDEESAMEIDEDDD